MTPATARAFQTTAGAASKLPCAIFWDPIPSPLPLSLSQSVPRCLLYCGIDHCRSFLLLPFLDIKDGTLFLAHVALSSRKL